MDRNIFNYLIITLKGMAMGAADVVPGVSGGTIAFISGIYEELLGSISAINLGLLKTLRDKGIKEAWKQVNGNFLFALFLGIGMSIISLAKGIKWLLEHEPVLLWSFFFGLVLASIVFMGKQISRWNLSTLLAILLGAIVAYYITTLNPMVSAQASPLYLFMAGAIAICAMILPGISGAFILVLLGAYQPVLTAIDTRDFMTIGIVGLGAVVGLLSFSNVLKWLFRKYHTLTLAALTGFIVGSLDKIWPWKHTLSYRTNSKGIQVPFQQESIMPFQVDGDPQILPAIFLALLGFGLIVILEYLAVKED